MLPKTLTLLLGAAALLGSLSACVPIVATGIGAGVAATMDRRSYAQQVVDQKIEARLNNRMADMLDPAARVSVTCFNRVVLLTGQVPDEATRAKAESLVTLPDEEIRSIHNELQVAIRVAFDTQANDALITSNLKSLLLTNGSFDGSQFKVVTERNVVYLMGLVTEDEAQRATAIASRAKGVSKVVRVVELISAEDARKRDKIGTLAPPPAAAKP